MIIKNISSRIINIGTTVLMPDHTMPASEAVCETPAIKAFVKKGWLELVKEKAKAPAAGKTGDDGKGKAPAAGKTANTGKTGDDGKTANPDA